MGIVAAFMVPHPPLIIPEIGKGSEKSIQDTIDAYERVAKEIEELKKKYQLQDEEIAYVGDDIPDYEVLQRCGLPCCPADAAPEIKDVCIYISHKNGGQGCARDILEQILKAQNLWMHNSTAFGW